MKNWKSRYENLPQKKGTLGLKYSFTLNSVMKDKKWFLLSKAY